MVTFCIKYVNIAAGYEEANYWRLQQNNLRRSISFNQNNTEYIEEDASSTENIFLATQGKSS